MKDELAVPHDANLVPACLVAALTLGEWRAMRDEAARIEAVARIRKNRAVHTIFVAPPGGK